MYIHHEYFHWIDWKLNTVMFTKQKQPNRPEKNERSKHLKKIVELKSFSNANAYWAVRNKKEIPYKEALFPSIAIKPFK